ncbi:hypothetical protein [Geothrix oryzisoli]|uniref:hypothetical protein n=1 Tax=Geothrix oryzisoli TaxID=2922721 RepID=UPI001FAE5665|nr:hypothetical protein [Geothrix oryzisoli]
MPRTARILAALLFGGTLLMAQLPNPLGLPDPLGLSKKPAPAPRQEGRRVEPKRGNHGKHKGQAKREGGERAGRKGSGRR